MSDESANLAVTLHFLQLTPSKLTSFIKDLSDSDIRLKLDPEEFSVLENICHLRDLEREGYAPRIDRILTEDGPSLDDFDGARIAAERPYNSEEPGAALNAFVTTRSANLQKLKGATPEQLTRIGTLAGVGQITLARLAELMREHDSGHLDDIASLVRRVK